MKIYCNQCDSKFSKQSNLTTHIKLLHEGIRYECIQCDYVFTNRSNLRNHIRSRHEGVKYDCKSKIFKLKILKSKII